MNSRMLTLFGEETQNTPPPLGRGKGKKKSKDEPVAEKPVIEIADPLAGWKADKHYYAIGEVATLFGITASTIRFWTNEFKLKVRTTGKGDRLYNEAQIQELRAIYNLVKIKGHKINAARVLLKDGKKTEALDTLELKHSLLKLRNLLVSINNNITS